MNPTNPIIVQSDGSILVEMYNPLSSEVVDRLRHFAELEKALEHIHTYNISKLSLWNAASIGLNTNFILDTLNTYTKFPISENVTFEIEQAMEKYGLIKLIKHQGELFLFSEEKYIIKEIFNIQKLKKYFKNDIIDDNYIELIPLYRGHIKHELINIGYPVEDNAGFIEGDPLKITLREATISGKDFNLRKYQKEAVDSFYKSKDDFQSAGVIVLPCGAGKTIVAMGAMSAISQNTLIMVTNQTALKQWKNEILDKTYITEDMIGEYSGETKEIKPITIATYQIITHRKHKGDKEFTHFKIFNAQNWGLLIYDEVHLLPAPVFRITSEIQSKRRLGLTATLVREDGKEKDVFSLIGPKKYDVSWKELEEKGFIAKAVCKELRVDLKTNDKKNYAFATDREKFRISSENKEKLNVINKIISIHPDELILIIGQYIDQLEIIAKKLHTPIITGKTKYNDRIELFDKFKTGEQKILVVSKVANFSVDLPDASVAIQISGTFGSRQEEAQRLGRILRPKKDNKIATFYSIITKDTVEQEFAMKRQSFLTMQGYKYEIYNWTEFNENN